MRQTKLSEEEGREGGDLEDVTVTGREGGRSWDWNRGQDVGGGVGRKRADRQHRPAWCYISVLRQPGLTKWHMNHTPASEVIKHTEKAGFASRVSLIFCSGFSLYFCVLVTSCAEDQTSWCIFLHVSYVTSCFCLRFLSVVICPALTDPSKCPCHCVSCDWDNSCAAFLRLRFQVLCCMCVQCFAYFVCRWSHELIFVKRWTFYY